MGIYRFSGKIVSKDSDWENPVAVLGGKGWGLQKMCSMGLNVPPGFTISTDYCNAYRKLGGDGLKKTFLKDLMNEVIDHMSWLTQQFGYLPLVSVRSGAPVSMPGMMDTVLNVGMNNTSSEEWIKRIGEKAALDSYRRLIQMMGHTAYGVPAEVFEFQLAKIKKNAGVQLDAELDATYLNGLLIAYLKAFHENTDLAFPQSTEEQLQDSIVAVFNSWMNPRAIEYRKQNNISEDMGTAVTIQSMVFGNMGEDSGSGVLFTRDPSTGAKVIMGEYLSNAQGEDVVAGIRTPDKLDFEGMKQSKAPAWKWELGAKLCNKLEAAYGDMVDVEFTVQKGELFILQSRVGKRSAAAAFKIAVDLVDEGVIDRKEAFTRLTRNQFKIVRKPTIAHDFKVKPNVVGLPACPGVAVGKPVFSSEEAVACTEPCILVTHETTPDDIAGMAKAVGILTQTGGATSHAAVVARAMDKPCIVGCTDIDMAALKKWQGHEMLTLDGGTGRVWFGVNVPVIDSSDKPEVKDVMRWCMEELGWCEQAVVDQEEGNHRILAAAWWGDEDVADAILQSLEQMPDRQHVTLDLLSPTYLTPSDDKNLLECFGTKETEGSFLEWLTGRLLNYKLNGLTVVNHGLGTGHAYLTTMKKSGIIAPGPATTVADLFEGTAEVTDKFVEEVIGGSKYYQQLKAMLAKAGVKQKTVQRAAPADYAAFTVLAK